MAPGPVLSRGKAVPSWRNKLRFGPSHYPRPYACAHRGNAGSNRQAGTAGWRSGAIH